MVALSWNDLMSVNLDDIVRKDVTDLYNALLEFEADDEDNPAKLKKLFKVTQVVLTVKGMEAEQVLDQLAKEAAEEGRKAAQKNQEIEDLKVEVQTLRKKNRDMEQVGGSSGMNWKDRNFRETIEELESQVTTLHKDLKEYKMKWQEEKEISEKYRMQSEEFERKVREMKIDNEQLREDLRDIQRQSDAQRESLLNKMDSDQQMSEKMKNKNIMLNNTLDENRKLSEYNLELERQIEKMKEEMIDGKNEIDKTTDDYFKLKLLVNENEGQIDKYVRENGALKLQIEELLCKLKVKSSDEDELLKQVNDRVEEWKLILSDKDEKIKDLQGQVLKLRDELLMRSLDADRASVTDLTKMLAERDDEIAKLVEKLREAGLEMENNASFMEDVKSRLLRVGVNEAKLELEKKVGQLQNKLEEKFRIIRDLEMRTETAESDAIAKDKQLNEVYNKMSLYEKGIYGLPEAVSEVKQLEAKLNERDRMVEELTQYVNRCEYQLNELYDEAEDLRERLGLDPKKPLCIEGATHRRGLNIMKDKSLNRVLQKEIERLEDERLELKKQIREMSQTTGQRAAILGLSMEDMELVNSFIEELKDKKDPQEKLNLVSSFSRKSEISYKEKYSSEELEKNTKKLNILYEENTELKSRLLELDTENKLLEKVVREIREQTSNKGLVNSESLDKLLEIMDSRSIVGRHDKAVVLKAQLDNLKGRSEEMRRELKEVKLESSKSQDVIAKLSAKNMSMEMELKSFKDQGMESFFHNLKLPTSMNPSTSEVIGCLNEHLLVTLEELSEKKDLLKKCEENFEVLKKKFGVAIHRQGLVYDEIQEQKKTNDSEINKLKKELEKKEEQMEGDAIKIQEFERLLETLSKDEDEVKQRIADACRRVCILRTNEQTLSRKYSIVWNSEAKLRKENLKLKSDSVEIEKSVIEKIGYLQRAKDSAVFKLSMVQRALENSVPSSDLDVANKQFAELTEKYRALLEATNSLVGYKVENDSSQEELKCLKEGNKNLMKELSLSKEMKNTYEIAMQRLQNGGCNETSNNCGEGITSNLALDSTLAKRMSTLEMKELNERQRAEHATMMYEQQKKQLRLAEDRICEIENKFSKLTQMNLELQKIERELRDELSNSVSKDASDADRKKISELEESEMSFKQEISRLKEVSEIALMQVQTMELQKLSNETEMTSLRQQLLDFQAQSDDKTVIGKLHCQVVDFQLKENATRKKLEKLTRKCEQLEVKSFRNEQKLDEKDAERFRVRMESSKRMRHLKMIIKECRRRYAGSVPLSEQEKFTNLLLKLQADKTESGIELEKAEEERTNVEEKLLELQTQQEGMKELISTLKDGKGAQKVWEWHKRMLDVRIEGLKLKRENEKLKQKMTFMEGMTKKLEADLKFLEEDKIRLMQEFEESEMEWEHREVELERNLQFLEVQLSQLTGNKFKSPSEEVSELNVDLPISDQLEQSLSIIKDREKKLKEAKAQHNLLCKNIEDLEIKLREKDGELVRRERVIAELRLHIPKLFEENLGGASNWDSQGHLRDNDKLVKVTRQAVQDLQARLDQKEETLSKYRKLLEQLQEDFKQSSDRYEKEVKQLQEQLHSKHEANLAEVKKIINENLSKPDKTTASGNQIRRLGELEELLAEQELVTCSLKDYLSEARSEIQDWKLKYENLGRKTADQLEELKDQHSKEVKTLELRNGDLEKSLDEIKFNLKEMKRKNSLSRQKQEEGSMNKSSLVVTSSQQHHSDSNSSKTPVTMMKRTIDNLKHELACKDQKIKTLSKALIDLRADMSDQAGLEARLSAETNTRKYLDFKTLNEKVEELNVKVKKSKDDNKALKERDIQLSEELEIVHDALSRKEAMLKRCQLERDKLSLEVEELRQKVERMNTMAKQRPETEGFYQELDELRRRNKFLIEELEKFKLQPEKPFEQESAGRDKWEKKCEEMRTQLREKDVELMRLNSMTSMLKTAAYREKGNQEILQKDRVRYSMTKKEGPPPMFGQMQELKRQVKNLSDEVSMLRQEKVSLNRDLEEVQSQNKMLSKNLLQLERKDSSVLEKGPDYKELLQKENILKKRVIELSEKILQLNIELEQVNRDAPRLKEKLDDQQKYIDFLKSEKKQREMISRSRESLSSFGSQSSSVRKIGESGRSPKELEKIISVLKKAVDKKRAEIDEIKLKLKQSESLLGLKEQELEDLRKEHEKCGRKEINLGPYEKRLNSLERELLIKDGKIKELQDTIQQMRRG